MKRIYHAADSLGRKRCAQDIYLHGKRNEDERAQCMRAAVDGDYCRQHADMRKQQQESVKE